MSPSTSTFLFVLFLVSNVSSKPVLKKNPPSIQSSISSFKESLSSVLHGNKVVLKPPTVSVAATVEEVPKPEVVQVVENEGPIVEAPEVEDTPAVDTEAAQEDMLVDENAMITGEVVVDFNKEAEKEEEKEPEETNEEVNEATEEENNETDEETENSDENTEEDGKDEEDGKVEGDDGHQIVISKATFVNALNKFLDTLLKAKIELHKVSKGGLSKLSKDSSMKESPRSLGSFRIEKSIRRNDATDRVIDEFSKKILRRESGKNVIDATNILEEIQHNGKY